MTQPSDLVASIKTMRRQTRQYWLAELDQHGNARLVDGAHSKREPVDAAARFFEAQNPGARYACAEVILTSTS